MKFSFSRIFRQKNLINENWKFCIPHREKYIQLLYFSKICFHGIQSAWVFFLILRRKLLQRDRTFIQFPIPVTLTGGFVNQNR